MGNLLFRLFPNANKAWAATVATEAAVFAKVLWPDLDTAMIAVVGGALSWGLTWLISNREPAA